MRVSGAVGGNDLRGRFFTEVGFYLWRENDPGFGQNTPAPGSRRYRYSTSGRKRTSTRERIGIWCSVF